MSQSQTQPPPPESQAQAQAKAQAPYWGQLPAPKLQTAPAPAPSRSRHSSTDARPNRVSVQTSISADAPTESSSQSPYATPTRFSFHPQGLAPRPPSLPYGAEQYPPDAADPHRRRGSRLGPHDSDLDTPHDEPMSTGPDGPRPPLSSSHRPPFGAGEMAVSPSTSGPPRFGAPSNQARQELEEYYKQHPPPERRSSQRNGSYDSAAPSRRRSSASADPASKKFAVDRSPLQRLELTLDSITKEEKRARVAAAEERARQKALGAAAEVQQGTAPLSPDRQQSITGPHVPRRQAHGPITAHRGPLSQNPPDDGVRYGSTPARNVAAVDSPLDSRTPMQAGANSDVPRRNLSFRERTNQRSDLDLPDVDDMPPPPVPPKVPIAKQVNIVSRSGSNKLRKDPPAAKRNNGQQAPERNQPTSQTPPESTRFAIKPILAGHHARASGPPSPPEYSPTTVERRTPSFWPGSKAVPGNGDYTVPPHPAAGPKAPGRGPGPAGYPPQKGPVAFAGVGPAGVAGAGAAAAAAGRMRAQNDEDEDDTSDREHHRFSKLVYRTRYDFLPGQGLYKKPPFLDEWTKATIGALSGSLLDLTDVQDAPIDERNQAWWEKTPSKGTAAAARPRKAEAFDGEYDETNGAPTRFKPPLYLKCGPLLRYCGLRTERGTVRSARGGPVLDREIWRGSIMIVTRDSESSYEIAPTLRLFAQPVELLPPPPDLIRDEQVLAPEHVDPIAGHPKLGRRGETLYVRPVEHLEEAKDLSRDETDDGLFERVRSPPDYPLENGATEPHGSFSSRRERARTDGEKLDKYKDIRGFRLHAERGCTFWRFNIEVELRDQEQRIAYRINRGPSTGFWVPARGQSMHIMFHSCNGFSAAVNPDDLSGPDPMWRDVLNTHQSRPFHVMIGGGDQIYNDAVMDQSTIFKQWLEMLNPLQRHNAPFTPELQDELEDFFLERYCMWFSQGLFGMANSQIPMVNMYDDHDIIDGFGSYPHHFMTSPVFSGLGNVAFKYYMLFQHQSVPDETEASEPSWALGVKPGPYITERSRSLFISLGGNVALLAVDCRTERTHDEVVSAESWQKLMDRCYSEIRAKGRIKHLLVLLGVPIAYPRLVWLENILTSRLFEPIKALAKMGLMGGLLNKFDGGVEVLDDLDDHWTAKHHKEERKMVMEDFQDLAVDKSVRVTILSGDVHLAAVGQFYSNPKLGLPKHKDFRYMPNVISSAIVNTPPPDMLADVLNKRNKIHVLDNDERENKETFEDMIPLFGHGVDGKPRNNKRLLPHRNWCSIRHYVPGDTPPSTPGISPYDGTRPGPPQKRRVMRRLSKKRPPMKTDVSRPPVSGGGGLFGFSRAKRGSADDVGPHMQHLGGLTRTMSLTRGDFPSPPAPGSVNGGGGGISGLFRRLSGRGSKRMADTGKKPDDGGINGQWGYDSPEENMDIPPAAARRLGLRGGGGRDDDVSSEEYYEGDESYFTARPVPQPPRGGGVPHGYIQPPGNGAGYPQPGYPQPGWPPHQQAMMVNALPGAEQDFQPKPLHRTPTGMTAKQLKRSGGVNLDVNLEDALLVTLNVEVNAKDPAGITSQYRLVVPRLWYDKAEHPPNVPDVVSVQQQPTGLKRLFSLKRAKSDAGQYPAMSGANRPPAPPMPQPVV